MIELPGNASTPLRRPTGGLREIMSTRRVRTTLGRDNYLDREIRRRVPILVRSPLSSGCRTPPGLTAYGCLRQHARAYVGRGANVGRRIRRPRPCGLGMENDPPVPGVVQDHRVEEKLRQHANLDVPQSLSSSNHSAPSAPRPTRSIALLPPVNMAPARLGGPSNTPTGICRSSRTKPSPSMRLDRSGRVHVC